MIINEKRAKRQKTVDALDELLLTIHLMTEMHRDDRPEMTNIIIRRISLLLQQIDTKIVVQIEKKPHMAVTKYQPYLKMKDY